MAKHNTPLTAAFSTYDYENPLWLSRRPFDFELDLLRDKAREQIEGEPVPRHLALVIVEIPPLGDRG